MHPSDALLGLAQQLGGSLGIAPVRQGDTEHVKADGGELVDPRDP